MEFSHPVKSDVIRALSLLSSPCSQSEVSLSGNKTPRPVQLPAVREHHLQGRGTRGLHLLRRLQPALQTHVPQREGGGGSEEGD